MTTMSYRCPVDIYETDEAYLINADMPGVKAEDLTLELDRDTLLLSGSIGGTEEADEGKRWERRLHLNLPVDRDQIAASLNDGVLAVRLPKHQEAQPRRIPVTAA